MLAVQERHINATVATRVIRDEKNHIDAVLADDDITVGGETYNVPKAGIYASWMLDSLQRHSLYATRLAYASKEGVLRRSVLRPYEQEVRERGYIRSETKDTGYAVNVRMDEDGEITDDVVTASGDAAITLDPDARAAMVDSATKLFRSFQNRYATQGLVLEAAAFPMGIGRMGNYLAMGFPAVPSTSVLSKGSGEPADYRLLAKGKEDEFVQNYLNILAGFGVTEIPG